MACVQPPSDAPALSFSRALDDLLESTGMPLERNDVTTTAGPTRVTSWGPTTGPALVLLHGHGATSGSWVRLVPHLADSWRVHAVDLVGDAGHSRVQRAPRRPSDLVEWLDDVVGWAAGGRSVALGGHSYGGWLATEYALHRPALVHGLLLVDPTDCFTGLSARYVLRALPLLVRPSPRAWRSFLAWETAGAHCDQDWAEVAALATRVRGSRVVRPRRPSPQALRELACRTVLVVADQSRAHDTARLVTGAADLFDVTVVHVDATHHSLPTARCEEMSAAVNMHLPTSPHRPDRPDRPDLQS